MKYQFVYGDRAFRDETGFITNFDSDRHVIYERAIAEFANTHPDYKLHIGAASNCFCDYGLYHTAGPSDLSAFWVIYNRIRDERAASRK